MKEITKFLLTALGVLILILIASITPSDTGVIQAVILGTFAASATNSIQLTYLPQYLGFTIATVPTSLIVDPLGDGTSVKLDGAGITAFSSWRQFGTIANAYVFQVADGRIGGKNVIITIANAQAAVLTLHGWSYKRGSAYVTYQQQLALANSGLDVTDFAGLAIVSPTANDIYNVSMVDGTTDSWTNLDLSYQQLYLGNVTSNFVIDNTESKIKLVNIIPDTARDIYIAKYQMASGIVDNAPIQ